MRKFTQSEIKAVIASATGEDNYVIAIDVWDGSKDRKDFFYRDVNGAAEYVAKLGCYAMSAGHDFTDLGRPCTVFTVCTECDPAAADAVTMWDAWADVQDAIAGGDAVDVVTALRRLEFAVECTGDGADLSGAFAQLKGHRH